MYSYAYICSHICRFTCVGGCRSTCLQIHVQAVGQLQVSFLRCPLSYLCIQDHFNIQVRQLAGRYEEVNGVVLSYFKAGIDLENLVYPTHSQYHDIHMIPMQTDEG